MESVVAGESMLRESRNVFDWLGHGIYFWENSPSRALEFAKEQLHRTNRTSGVGAKHAVIGAVIDLGQCLDLLDFGNLTYLKSAYEMLVKTREYSGLELPQNRKTSDSHDLLLRDLDCAVLETLHYYRGLNNQPPFDSVRGAFWEGKELYPNAGFREKDHIQICVRNPNCIKGLFVPRKEDSKFPAV